VSSTPTDARQPAGIPGAPPAMTRSRLKAAGPHLRRWGVLGTFALAFLVFSAAEPSRFLAWDNFSNILSSSAVPMIVACGVTIPLIMSDFDLSIGGVVAFGGSIAIVLQTEQNWYWVGAVIAAIIVAIAIGKLHGLLIAKYGGSSFVITLALGSVYSGLVLWLTDSQTIYSGIDSGFLAVGQSDFLGIRIPIWIAIGFAFLLFLITERMVVGRRFYAVGENITAAFLAGMSVGRLRTYGFICSAIAAAMGGMLIFAEAGSTYANPGQPLLLAAFSAAFLGAALRSNGRFSVLGSAVSVVLVQMVTTGLVILNLPEWTASVFEGSILAAAIMIAPSTRVWK